MCALSVTASNVWLGLWFTCSRQSWSAWQEHVCYGAAVLQVLLHVLSNPVGSAYACLQMEVCTS